MIKLFFSLSLIMRHNKLETFVPGNPLWHRIIFAGLARSLPKRGTQASKGCQGKMLELPLTWSYNFFRH
jgi:hypothetical protein